MNKGFEQFGDASQVGREEAYANLESYLNFKENETPLTTEEWNVLIGDIPLKEVNSDFFEFLDANSEEVTDRRALRNLVRRYRITRLNKTKD